jgi:hypothetical protein
MFLLKLWRVKINFAEPYQKGFILSTDYGQSGLDLTVSIRDSVRARPRSLAFVFVGAGMRRVQQLAGAGNFEMGG